MNASSLAATTLAAHANVAAATGRPLRLPAHPAFLVVRRVRCQGAADVAGWFEQLAGTTPLDLADPGLAGPAQLQTVAAAWTLSDDDAGLRLSATPRVEAPAPVSVDAATAALESASLARVSGAPAAWLATAGRASAILASAGTGEELSDVAWPHFLLPAASPLPARRLAAAAATLWSWDQPGAWAGADADAVRDALRAPVGEALRAAVAASA